MDRISRILNWLNRMFTPKGYTFEQIVDTSKTFLPGRTYAFLLEPNVQGRTAEVLDTVRLLRPDLSISSTNVSDERLMIET